MQLQVLKVRDVKTPERTGRNAGFDFFVPNDFEKTYLELGQSINIPSGIKVRIPEGYALIAFNKSGIAVNYGLQPGACVVDENYTGEIHLHMTKTTGSKTLIKPGMKLVQFVLVSVNYAEVVEYKSEEEMYEGFDTEERGEGKFGSTGLR